MLRVEVDRRMKNRVAQVSVGRAQAATATTVVLLV